MPNPSFTLSPDYKLVVVCSQYVHEKGVVGGCTKEHLSCPGGGQLCPPTYHFPAPLGWEFRGKLGEWIHMGKKWGGGGFQRALAEMTSEVSLSKSIYNRATVAFTMPLFHTVSPLSVCPQWWNASLSRENSSWIHTQGGWLAPFINYK